MTEKKKTDEFDINKYSKKRNGNYSNKFSLITQIGIYLIVTIFMCFYFGVFLDNILKTNYVFTVISIIIGVLSGFIGVYKLVMKEVNRMKSDTDYLNIDEYKKKK